MQTNPTPTPASPQRYPTPPAWTAAAADEARIEAQRVARMAAAAPVRLVDLTLSFGTIFRLCLFVAISQAIIAGAVLVAYLIAINVA